jgi:hypothetical protein
MPSETSLIQSMLKTNVLKHLHNNGWLPLHYHTPFGETPPQQWLAPLTLPHPIWHVKANASGWIWSNQCRLNHGPFGQHLMPTMSMHDIRSFSNVLHDPNQCLKHLHNNGWLPLHHNNQFCTSRWMHQAGYESKVG